VRTAPTQQAAPKKEVDVHGWIDGWDWIWMSTLMLVWLVALGAVVYVAVRLATPADRKPDA